MITTEIIELNGKKFRRTSSDTFLIQKDGTDEIYSEAADLLESLFTYAETDILLETEDEEMYGLEYMNNNIDEGLCGDKVC